MSDAKNRITQTLGSEMDQHVRQLTNADANRLATILTKPTVNARINRTRAPYGATLYTSYGSVSLDNTLTRIEYMYINGQRFSTKENGLDAIEKATGTEEDIREILGEASGRQRRGRKVRSRAAAQDIPFEVIQNQAYEDLGKSNLTYDSIFSDLGGLMSGRNVDVSDIVDELFANRIDEEDIPHFLAYESSYKHDILSQVYGVNIGSVESDYNFVTQGQDDSFVGQLLTRLNVEEAEYDAEAGVLLIGDREITNLPQVDENGVFSNGQTRYIPHYTGYFVAGEGTRAERLRISDPVQNALDAVALQYDVTGGDIKFKTLLTVTRNLPDFESHTYGEEILHTLKNKVVFDKSYDKTNSLLADYEGKADSLGAVALTMLDDDAEGLIDPLGTSNGANLGTTVYLADGVQVKEDGSLVKSDQKYSKVGQILQKYDVDKDNFNRNQMSFNAFLTSTDVSEINVAYAEFAMWNSEDAVGMLKRGADNAFAEPKHEGDKMMDTHGNKSVISLIIDPDMSDEEAERQKLTGPVQFARNNPNVDMIVSPISIASRLNMGVVKEGLKGEKSDITLADGTVVKDGVVKMLYMSLPQTSENKSKDYAVEGNGRRYSTLLRYALSSKIGADVYEKALINPETKQENIDKVVTTFERLGVSFDEPSKLIREGNVQTFVDAPVEVDKEDLRLFTASVIREQLNRKMEDGRININLGEMSVTSPLTGLPIQDSFGENVLPIAVEEGGHIPYRYMDVFEAVSLENHEKLEQAYARASAIDYSALVRKDNLLKNVNTMAFKESAHTDVLIPDPRLKLNEVRVDMEDDRVIIHRDPAIRSGNVMSVDNVRNGAKNVVQVNPLIEEPMNADNDGDTLGVVGYSNVNLPEDEKEDFYNKSSVLEQLNHYGDVYLSTGSHLDACVKAGNIDASGLTFDDGKTNEEVEAIANDIMAQIVDAPESYGAYALSFENEETVKKGLVRLADEGIKGDREDIMRVFDEGYTPEENRAILKALVAKSEWTGLAGATTNTLIASLDGDTFDPEMTRVSMDMTHSITQSVLQMKKNADKLPEIDQNIKTMKSVMSGKYTHEESREILKEVTSGLIDETAVDKFVDLVSQKSHSEKFGHGVINNTDTTTMKLAYSTGNTLGKALTDMGENLEIAEGR